MSYAAKSDMEARFVTEEIAALANDPADAEADRTVGALADASADIDSRLAVAFRLPLSGAFPILAGIACDLARARLYDEDPPKAVLRRRKAAFDKLDKIAGGEHALVSSTGAVAERIASGAAVAAAPVFGDDALEGLLQ